MDNSWFRKAGSLEETKINETFFKPAGDLSTGKSDVSSYFSRPGDLEVQKQNNSFIFEEKKDEPFKTPEEIKEWLKTIVSGVKKSNYAFGEGLQVVGAGQKFVSIE